MGQSLTAAGLGIRVPLHAALPGPGHFRRQRDHKAACACERARSCLQRAGYGYADGGVHLRCGAAGPETIYQQQRRPHIRGNMMPLALLRGSSFFAATIAELRDAAVQDGVGVPAAVAAPAITEPATGQIRQNWNAPAANDGSAVYHRIVRRQVNAADDSARAEPAVAAAAGAGVALTSLTGGIGYTVQVRANHLNGHSDCTSATATLNQFHWATRIRRAGPAPPATSALRRQSDLIGQPRCV